MRVLQLIASVAVGVLVGAGVPLGWVWIGSQLQGDDGASSLSFAVVAVMMAGMLASYGLVMYAAGWVIARRTVAGSPNDRARGKAWSRGSHEGRRVRATAPGAVGVEQVFVYTTLIVAALFWLWFLFLAGSPLPNQ